MSFSNYLELELLDAVVNNGSFAVAQAYCSLHTGDPGETGANEVTGGSYARQSLSFAAAASGSAASDATINFTLMPSCTVTHLGLWDAASNGNFLAGGLLAESKVVALNDTFRFTSGTVVISLD